MATQTFEDVTCGGAVGRLILRPSSLEWRIASAQASASAVQIAFADVSSLNAPEQFVSPPDKPKLLLKVELKKPAADGTASYIFEFGGPHGDKNRNAVKEAILQSLAAATKAPPQPAAAGAAGGPPAPLAAPAAARPATTTAAAPAKTASAPPPSTPTPPPVRTATPGGAPPNAIAAARATVLSKNPQLAELHRNLVQSNLITEDDFWATRQGLVTAVLQQQQQKAGVPNALLWNVQPTAAQGATDKYTLTPQIMRSIMDQYPAVELAYKELVPDKMSEEAFWKRVLLSLRMNQDPSAAARGDNILQPFEQLARRKELERRAAMAPKHLLTDLTATEEDHLDDLGNRPDPTMLGGRRKEINDTVANLQRHSTIVLTGGNRGGEGATAAATSPPAPAASPRSASATPVLGAILLDDLAAPPPPADEPLPLPDPTRLEAAVGRGIAAPAAGLAPATGDAGGAGTPTKRRRVEGAHDALRSWQLDATVRMSGAAAWERMQALLAVRDPTAGMAPGDASVARDRQGVSELFSTVCEVLRHFWAALLARDQMERTQRMVVSLRNLKTQLQTEMGKGDSAGGPPAPSPAAAIQEQHPQALATILAMVDKSLTAYADEEKRRQERERERRELLSRLALGRGGGTPTASSPLAGA